MEKYIFDKNVVIEDDICMRNKDRNTLNRLCDISDWRAGEELTNTMRELNEGCYIHRKAWEYALCVNGLEKLGVVNPKAKALAVGAGYERPLFYFANKINEMVATDLYDNPDHEGKPEMLTMPEKFAPFPYRKKHLKVMQMSGDDLQFEENSFDFAFCLSSLEHFGGGDRAIQKQSMREVFRVLKPNGVYALATEYIINDSSHQEYFNSSQFQEVILDSTEFAIVGGDVDLSISRSTVENPIDLDKEENLNISPHIVLKQKDVIFTSLMIFLRKLR